MHNTRKDGLIKQLKQAEMESFLITDPVNIRYICGFTGTSGFLLVTQKRSTLLTDFRYIEQAESETKGIKDLQVIKHDYPVSKTIQEIASGLNTKTIYFEKKHLTYDGYEKLKAKLDDIDFIPHEGMVESLRMQKDESEINKIEAACEISDAAFSHIISYIRPGVKERDLSIELEYYMKKSGAEGISFDIIVASGERSSLPHGVASDREIKPGDLLKMDFGAVYNGYCSDITRTLMLATQGEREKIKTQEKIYEIVLKAQTEALKGIEPGMTVKDADNLARNVIIEAGYGKYFGHGLGHGIGLKVHESPTLSINSNDVLKENMVFTVEPGIYLPDKGGVRIEDTVQLKPEGCTALTKSTKKLIII